MILLLIFVVAVLLITIGYILEKTNCLYLDSLCQVLGIILTVLCLILTVLCGIEHATKESQLAANRQIYNSLTYQLQNNLYDNDNDYGKKALYDEVKEYNKDLAFGKFAQRNFWIGVFYANFYDDLDFINLQGEKDNE